MDKLFWFFQTSGGFELAGHLSRPLLVAFLLYLSNYLVVFTFIMLRRGGLLGRNLAIAPGDNDALLVMPTLLGKRAELEGIQRAVESVLTNGYPGPLVVCVAVDHADQTPSLCRELERWMGSRTTPPGLMLRLARLPERGGKSMAIEAAVKHVEAMVAGGELARFPRLFYNMDADSELSPFALVRMAARLTRRGRFSRERPMAVASNVCVRESHAWRGLRHFFTVPGQLAAQVAREYLTSISIARHNTRLLPMTSVSGALYCTWSELYRHAPRYGAFVKTLRVRDLLKWWAGGGAPSYARSKVTPIPEATVGPGDDTWLAWLALSARWKKGRIDLELPATPFHALAAAIRCYFFRPLAYDSAAKIYTATPTTVRGLFKQRVRWNSSRVWLLGRFGLSPFFKWSLGGGIYIHVICVVGLHAAILLGLLLWPLTPRPTQWLALLAAGSLIFLFMRAIATCLALLQDSERGGWHRLLALPLSGMYHLVFNVVTTIVGLVQDLLLFGVNTGFAPQETLIRSGTGRVALAYRFRRALKLSVRALRHGDVPFGAFWFGWHATPWTEDGYTGWTKKLK